MNIVLFYSVSVAAAVGIDVVNQLEVFVEAVNLFPPQRVGNAGVAVAVVESPLFAEVGVAF